jgi:hypothetical protein
MGITLPGSQSEETGGLKIINKPLFLNIRSISTHKTPDNHLLQIITKCQTNQLELKKAASFETASFFIQRVIL